MLKEREGFSLELMDTSDVTLDLEGLRDTVRSRAEFLNLHGNLLFSRGPRRFTNSVLVHDKLTEDLSRFILENEIGLRRAAGRLYALDPCLQMTGWPEYAPYRIKTGHDIGGRENVFLAFPYAVGANAHSYQQLFGLELVEFTEQIHFRIIVPSVRRVFSNHREIIHELARLPIATSIYLYGVFHELAHYMGRWSLAEQKRANNFNYLTASELAADEISFYVLQELRPVLLRQLLMRLFWYLPKGSPAFDSDVAVSYYFLNELWGQNILTQKEDSLHLHLDKLCARNAKPPDFEKIQEAFFGGAIINNDTCALAQQLCLTTSDVPRELV
ncbi:MAG: hypothetical protein C5B49_05585 [Bdellovibrio sp.]|nr:MAG: hypothetical protein C5B49_05585 [Bdellovibrio sp.]